MARLVFVNRFYWPDETATGQLLTDLAEALAAHGHEVTVVTSRPAVLPADFASMRNGVHIAHVGSTRASGGGLAAKAIDFLTFYLGALWQLLRQTRRNSIVVALTDPPLIGIGAWLVSALRGAKLIHWVQDIYPELAIRLTGQSWLRLFRPLRNASWRRAVACVTLGDDMATRLRAAGVDASRLQVIPNWAPRGVSAGNAQEIAALRSAWGLSDKFVVGYSGNLGRVHDLDAVLDLAAAFSKRPDFVLIIVGGGAQRTRLESAAKDRGLRNVAFFPAQPRAQLTTSLAVADLHLVTLKMGCEDLVFPSKLYGIVATGRPVVFIGSPSCDVACCVRENGLGLAIAPADIATSVPAIEQLAAASLRDQRSIDSAARRFAARHTAEASAGHWADLIDRVVRSRSVAAAPSLPPQT